MELEPEHVRKGRLSVTNAYAWEDKLKSLVLGGNGFIGSHLVDRLKSEGHEVSVFDRQKELFRRHLTGVQYYEGDFGNRGLLADALNQCDIVFHLISTTVPKTSNDDFIFDVQTNVIETIALLEKCIEIKVKKIVFLSSGGTVYGKPRRLPVREDFETDPECSYGITKLTIEKYLALFNHLYGLDYSIIRPSNPYGERQNPDGIQGAISVFLGKAVRNMPVEIWGDGGIVRDYVYVKDLVDAIYKAAIVETKSRIFNVGSGTGHSLNQIISEIQNVVGREIPVHYSAKRNFDVPSIYLDISRAKEELSWIPAYSMQDGLLRTWHFLQSLDVNSREL